MSANAHKVRSLIATFVAVVFLVFSCVSGVMSASADEQTIPAPTNDNAPSSAVAVPKTDTSGQANTPSQQLTSQEAPTSAQPIQSQDATTNATSPSSPSTPVPVSTYKVDFKVVGADTKAPATQTIVSNKKVLRPTPDPVRNGYRFLGWFNNDIEFDFSTPVTSDLTLTAHWVQVSGSWALSPDHGPISGGTEVTLVPPKIFGFTQVSAGASRSLAIGSDGNAYTWTDKTTNATDDSSVSPVLIAQPKGSDSTTGIEVSSVQFGSDGSEISPEKKDNGTWRINTPSHQAGSVDAIIHYSLDGKALEEQHKFSFDMVTYAVTFDKADKSPNSTTRVQVIKGQTVTRPENPEHKGWKFIGWFLDDAQGSSVYDFSQPVTKQVTLTAHWMTDKGPQPKGITGRSGRLSGRSFDNSCFIAPNATHTQHWKIDYCRGPENGGNTVRLTPPNLANGISNVSVSDNFAAAVVATGDLYTWGSNDSGQLGNNGGAGIQQTPTKVDTLPGVAFVKVGTGHNFAVGLTRDGKLYAWGDNSRGQLGIGNTGSTTMPVSVLSPSGAPAGFEYVYLEVGYDFVVAYGGVPRVTVDPNTHETIRDVSNLELYSWGSADFGQLGQGAVSGQVTSPTLVQKGQMASTEFPYGYGPNIAVGAHHVVMRSSSSKVYTWGRNNSGQLANGDYTDRSAPSSVKGETPNAGGLAAGGDHTVIALGTGEAGTLYASGSNTHGELGIGSTVANVSEFTPIALPKPGMRFANASMRLGTNHTIVQDYDSKRLYICGSNMYGQLGDASSTDQSTLTEVPDAFGSITLTRAYAGSNSTFAVGTNGFLYAWGMNDNDQLGIQHDASATTQLTPSRTIFPAPGKIKSVTFGDVEGTDYQPQNDDSWLVKVPAHDQGKVVVTVQWTLYGVDQDPPQKALNYTYVRNMVLPNAGGSGMMVMLLILGMLTMAGSLAVRCYRQGRTRLQHSAGRR